MRHFAEFGLVLTQAYMIFHALSPTTPSEVAAIFFLWPKTAHNQKKEQKQNKRKQKEKKLKKKMHAQEGFPAVVSPGDFL